MTSLDELHEVRTGHRAVAVRHVPNTLDVFVSHFPRFPVLPGVLILDDLVAVARLAVSGPDQPGTPPGSTPPWLLASIHRVRFRHFVQPGDSLEVTAEVLDHDPGSTVVRGVVRVDGRPVTTVGSLVLHRPEPDAT